MIIFHLSIGLFIVKYTIQDFLPPWVQATKTNSNALCVDLSILLTITIITFHFHTSLPFSLFSLSPFKPKPETLYPRVLSASALKLCK